MSVDHLLKAKKEFKNLKKQDKSIYRSELGKARFQHDMVYGDFKYLARKTFSGKVSRDKAFNIAKCPKNDEYQGGITFMVYKFFEKKSSCSGVKINNEQLAEELHKRITKNIKKRKVYSLFKGNI